ncbi:MAG: ComEC/Rec2 family competence protein [Deltaproteobacteria bacterium]
MTNERMMPVWFGIFLFSCLGAILAFYHLLVPALIMIGFLLAAAWIKPKIAVRVLTAALIIGVSFVYSDLTIPPQPGKLPTLHQQDLVGRVDDYPSYDGRTASFVLKAEGQDKYLKKVQVFCFFDAGLKKGDRVSLHGDLKEPAPPGNPGEIDYPFYLQCQGIFYTMSIKEPGAVQILSRPRGPAAWLVTYQTQARDLFEEILPEEDADILLGMLLGIVEGIDPEEYRDYQKTGIIHVFSVSGMHIGFLLLVAAWLTSIMELKRGARLLVGIGLLLVYGSMTGWPPPVLRSSIMGGLGLIAYYSGRENSMLNSLGLAGLVILSMNPCAPLQISFQFTFLATWGLVYLFPLIKAKLDYRSRLWDLVLIPICAQLPMFPLLVYHFSLFSPVSILSNILLGYLSGAVVVLGFAALIFSGWLPLLAGLFLNPAGGLIELIRGINAFLVKLPGAYFWVAAPPVWTISIYYVGLLLVVYALACKKNRYWMISGAFLMGLLVAVAFLPASLYDRGTLEATFVDVGHVETVVLIERE